MNEELITIIEQLKNNFTYNDTQDYENLLLIIYNSIFLDEDNLTSGLKYKIFEAISTIINTVQIQKDNNKNIINKDENIKLLERVYIPFFMRDGLHPASEKIKELEQQSKMGY